MRRHLNARTAGLRSRVRRADAREDSLRRMPASAPEITVTVKDGLRYRAGLHGMAVSWLFSARAIGNSREADAIKEGLALPPFWTNRKRGWGRRRVGGARSKDCIYEWRHRRSLRNDQKSAKAHQGGNDGRQPPLLPCAHISP
jgi:hypothetical protein